MKKNKLINYFFILSALAGMLSISCSTSIKIASNSYKSDTIYSNINGKGIEMVIDFKEGKSHNHPTFAFWIEDMHENYIQSLFVTRSLATGIFGHAPINDSVWGTVPGKAYRPAALPYWNHKRTEQSEIKTLPDPENPVPDAYTGATPDNGFLLITKSDEMISGKFRLLLEVNQTWDWNEYWTNNKYPDDDWYKTSSQPSVIYAVTIDPESGEKEYYLNPIGHGHYAGRNGRLYTDLSSITTALDIIEIVKVTLK